MTAQLMETVEQHNRRVTMEVTIASHKAARLAREAALPATPAAMKAELERVAAETTAAMADDRGEVLRRIERDIGGRRAELRRQREARVLHEEKMVAVREAALREMGNIICVPPNDANAAAAEELRRAATGGSTEWQAEILAANQILEIGGYRSLAGWVALQLASNKPLWN